MFRGHQNLRKPSGTDSDSWHTITCGHCDTRVSAAVVAMGDSSICWLQCTNPLCGEPLALDSRGGLHPAATYGPAIESLPAEVAAAYGEVRLSMGASSHVSAMMMCRRILMSVAVDHGSDEGKSFGEYIDALKAAGLVTSAMKSWVDEIRNLGNVANHSIAPVDRRTAESAVMFVAQLLRNAYEIPEQHRQLTADKSVS